MAMTMALACIDKNDAKKMIEALQIERRAGLAAGDAERGAAVPVSAGAVRAEGAGQRDAADSHRHARDGSVRSRRGGRRARGYPALDSAAVNGSRELQFRPANRRRVHHWRSRCCSPSIFVIRRRRRFRATRCSNRETRHRHPMIAQRSVSLRTRCRAQSRRRTTRVLDTIGWTPLIRLNKVTRGIRTPVYAKAEIFNPGGSVKDRIGIADHRAGRARRAAQAGRDDRRRHERQHRRRRSRSRRRSRAIACIFTMPDKMSQEKVRLLKAFGAEVIITPTAVPPDHPDNYVMMAKRIAHGDAERDSRQPVLQRREPRGALRDHGPGALGADGRAHHALRRRGRHGRHDHRRRALPQGEEPEDPDHRRRSAGLDSRRVCGGARARTRSKACRTRSKASARTRFPARST